MPSATLVDGEIVVVYMLLPDLHVATSSDGGDSWDHEEDPVLVAGELGAWTDELVVGPSLLCSEDSAESRFHLYTGGKTEVDDGTSDPFLSLSLGEATSEDALIWTGMPDTPFLDDQENWDEPWTHWDALAFEDNTLLYYSRDNEEGLKSIGVTTLGPDWGTPRMRACPPLGRTPDTGEDSGTIEPVDSGFTEGDSAGDTGLGEEEQGCGGGCGGCASSSPPGLAWSWLVAGVLFGVRRR